MKLDVYFAACIAAGLLLRLSGIGEAPLAGAEAIAAFTAWTSIAGGQASLLPATIPDSALLHGLLASAFWLAGSGDAAARVPVAFASMIPVLLVWRAAPALGRVAAVTLAALLTLDPISIGYARLTDSAALSAATAWAVVISAVGASSPALADASRARWAHGVWIAAGICLISGPLAWDLLFPLSLLLVVLSQEGMTPVARRAAIVGLAALIAGSAALTRWEGLQFVSAGATYWLRTFSEDATQFGAPWTGIMRLETLTMALGLAGITLRLTRRIGPSPWADPFSSQRACMVLALWMLWGLIVTFRPGRSLTSWLVIQPPVFLGACYLATAIAAWARQAAPGRPGAIRWAAVAGALALLPLVGAAVKMAGGGRAGEFRPYATMPEPGVRHLARDMRTLLAAGDAPLDVVAPAGWDPLLGWYLREAPHVRWVIGAGRQPASALRYVLVPSATAATAPGDIAVYPVRRRADSREWMRLQQVGGGS